MAKRYFLTLDSETTQTNRVADLGIVVSDKQGNVVYSIGVMVADFYCDAENHPLFHIFGDASDVFSAASLPRRRAEYDAMIKDGRRMIASVGAVNRLLVKIRLQYNPTLTAYNLAFDADKCNKSGIDLSIFERSFCLWYAAAAKWSRTKAYRDFILQGHYFGKRTKTGCMTVLTNADVMAKFVLGDANLADEPHTALEDALYYEVPILTKLVNSTKVSEYMNPPAYNYRDLQMRDLYRSR